MFFSKDKETLAGKFSFDVFFHFPLTVMMEVPGPFCDIAKGTLSDGC